MNLSLKMLIALLTTLSGMTNLALAGLKSAGKTHLIQSQTESSAQITVDEGFHFNIAAPTYLENNKNKVAPSKATDKLLLFQWKEPLHPGAKVQYYVCDDAKTVCEPHTVKLATTSSEVGRSQKIEQKTQPTTLVIDEEGFILNDLKAGLAEAKKRKTLVLIDFTASWCPACIRLSHESFNTQVFQTVAAKYVLVKIDVDREDNQALMEQYSIRAFPTLVIADSSGVEIDRILDFLPATPLAKRLTELHTSRPLSIAELKKKAIAGDKTAALALGKNAFRAQRMKECLDWFEKSDEKPFEYYQCLISHSQNVSPESHSQNLQKAIAAYPAAFYSIDWRLELVELLKDAANFKEQNRKHLADAESLAQLWLSQPELLQQATANNELIELKDLVVPELHYSLGTIFELQNKKSDASKQFEMAVQKTLELKPSTDNPTIVIYLVHYLKKTRPTEEALSWLQKLEKAYPKEFTYAQRQASLLADAKDFHRALPIAEKAFDLSYGTNKLKTGLLLARIKKELKKMSEAKTLLQELKTSKAAQSKGNKHHLERIDKALSELG